MLEHVSLSARSSRDLDVEYFTREMEPYLLLRNKKQRNRTSFAFTCFACFRAFTVLTDDARVRDSIPNHGPHIAERSHLRISSDIILFTTEK